MRNRVARVARTTIATSRPKSSKMVADIAESFLPRAVVPGIWRVEEEASSASTQKTPGPADQASRRSICSYSSRTLAGIVPCLFLTGQEERIASRKICLCPLHQATYHRSGFHLCNKITSWLMFLYTTNGACYHAP